METRVEATECSDDYRTRVCNLYGDLNKGRELDVEGVESRPGNGTSRAEQIDA